MTGSQTSREHLVLVEAPAGWEGIWSLTHAAAFTALDLAMRVPLDIGVSISSAAMDFRAAQDEVEWAKPQLRASTQVVRPGPTQGRGTVARSFIVLDQLAAGALTRATALAELEPDTSTQATLAWVIARVSAGRARLSGRWL